MTFVNITALTYPVGAEDEIERRFAARPAGNHADDERRGMSVEIFGFEVVPADA